MSAGKNTARIQKAICSGFFRNASKKDPQEGYRTLVDGQAVYIHPSSALFNRQPEWFVFINKFYSIHYNLKNSYHVKQSGLCITNWFKRPKSICEK